MRSSHSWRTPDGSMRRVRGTQFGVSPAPERRRNVTDIDLSEPLHVENVSSVGAQLEGAFNTTRPPTAIVLQHEEALPEILRWLRSTARRVPEDVQVVLLGAWVDHRPESSVTFVSSSVDRITSAVVDLAIDAAAAGPRRAVLLPPEIWVSSPDS